MDDWWETRALPILEAVAKAEDDDADTLDLPALEQSLGCSQDQLANEIERLVEAGYMSAHTPGAMGSRLIAVLSPRLSERGARAVGRWPSDDPYQALVAVLERQLADPATPAATKTKLDRLLQVVTDVGQGTLTGVLVGLARGGLGV